MKKILVDDGSSIEWIDKETLKYREKEFSVLVRIDYYKTGFLTYGRTIKASSIVNWNTKAELVQSLSIQRQCTSLAPIWEAG